MCAAGPAEIAGHSPLTQAAKGLRIVLIQVYGFPDDIEHVTAGVIAEGEAVSGVPPGLIGLDGILQAAGLPDNGDGAVAHGDHLTQAAGLALGGHEEQIRTGIDGHGQGFVIVQTDGHTARILLGSPVEKVLVFPVALAQNNQLHRKLHHIMKDFTNQVQTLVGHQPADDGHDGGVGFLMQAHDLLQLRLIGVLAGHILHRVTNRDPLVGFRIVEIHINAVEHAGELIVAPVHDALHMMGKIGHLQFIGIGGGDGVDRVGAEDGALEEVHIAVHHDGAVGSPAIVQAEQIAQGILGVAALVLNVVNGQGGPDGTEAVFPHAVILQVNGDQSGLPVIAVDHVGPELEVGQHPHHSPGEEAEALSVIHVAIEVRAVEILLIIQEVPRHAVPLQGEQAAVAVTPGEIDEIVALKFQLAAKAFPNPPVQGKYHGNFCTLLGQSGRQGTGHIRQTAGFAKGNRLAGCIQDFHK